MWLWICPLYLDAHSIELLVPNMWKVKNATVHWHSEAGITMRQMYSSLHDILEDTIGGNLDIIGKSDIGDAGSTERTGSKRRKALL